MSVNRFILGSGYGLLPDQHQAITWISPELWLSRPLGTNLGQIAIKIQIFLSTKIHINISMSAKWWPFCLSFNVLTVLFCETLHLLLSQLQCVESSLLWDLTSACHILKQPCYMQFIPKIIRKFVCYYTPRFNEVDRGVYWFLYPPLQRSWEGGILVSPCPSVCLYVCGQNRVRSVSSTILIGSISYLHILSSIFRRCVPCNVCLKIKIFAILANSLNL